MKEKRDQEARSGNTQRVAPLFLRVYTNLGICCMLLVFFFLTSCSTEKAKWANIQYHNTTCHYNVWWNGNESLKAGRLKLQDGVMDDYTRYIMPENLGTDDEARSANPDMDRAVEKGIKGIKKHSIYVNGEEHVPYIRECYLLTAYATFYKHDYVATANTANILVSQFGNTRAGDEGAILLARCMTAEGRYTEAESTLDELVLRLAKGNFDKSVRGKLYCAMVEATVPQGKMKKSVEYIQQARSSVGDNRTKARLTFLLAQIYQQLDKRTVAAKYYHEVLRYSPDYEMEFNARLGEASCADLEHSDVQKLEKQLDAMLDDKKNEEYRDQIYFAKGEMYMGMKDAQKACDNYRLSVAVSTKNKAQRARSALRMGEVLYEIYENYDQAQRYYDTAMQNMAKDYPRYDDHRRRYEMLTELTSYTRVYERCDSLMTVAMMPEAERMQLIKNTIDTLKKREAEAKERALLEELEKENQAQMNTLKGDWYFYNSQTVMRGKETFRQRWGMRTLEDLWALENKTMLGVVGMTDDLADDEEELEEEDEETTDSTKAEGDKTKSPLGDPNDPHCIAYYLKDLPTTQAQFDSIDSLVAPALLGAGYIFYDGAGNTQRALECYLRLAESYTSFPDVVQAFYMLYRIYDRQGNTPQANYYRDMVLMGFPDSDFANLIRDNEFYKELMRRDRRMEEDYEEVYTQYGQRRYRRVLALVDDANQIYPASPQLNKFHYWQGLALAKLGRNSEATQLFEGMLKTMPRNDSLVPLVQAQLGLLAENRSDSTITDAEGNLADAGNEKIKDSQRDPNSTSATTEAPEDELPPEAQVFRYREGQQHYVIVLINDRTIKATELQYKLSDFNTQYYSNSGYKVNAMLFTDSTQLITIHRFVDSEEAMRYYNHLQQKESPLADLNPADHREFAISTQNYSTFYNRKDPDAYYLFFKRYYLEKDGK